MSVFPVQPVKNYSSSPPNYIKLLKKGTYLVFQWFSSVQSLSRVRLFATPWIAARQASLSITISRSSLRLTSIESMMPSSHLILGRPLLLLPPISPSIRVFSNESALLMRCPEYWSFSFSIIPSKEIPGLISFLDDLHHLLARRPINILWPFSDNSLSSRKLLCLNIVVPPKVWCHSQKALNKVTFLHSKDTTI